MMSCNGRTAVILCGILIMVASDEVYFGITLETWETNFNETNIFLRYKRVAMHYEFSEINFKVFIECLCRLNAGSFYFQTQIADSNSTDTNYQVKYVICLEGSENSQPAKRCRYFTCHGFSPYLSCSIELSDSYPSSAYFHTIKPSGSICPSKDCFTFVSGSSDARVYSSAARVSMNSACDSSCIVSTPNSSTTSSETPTKTSTSSETTTQTSITTEKTTAGTIKTKKLTTADPRNTWLSRQTVTTTIPESTRTISTITRPTNTNTTLGIAPINVNRTKHFPALVISILSILLFGTVLALFLLLALKPLKKLLKRRAHSDADVSVSPIFSQGAENVS